MKLKSLLNRNNWTILVYVITILVITSIFVAFIANRDEKADYSFDLSSIYDWSDEWEVIASTYIEKKVSLPLSLHVNSGETVMLKKNLPNKIKKYNCLMYESEHQDVIVNVGGILRTSYNDSKTRNFGSISSEAIVLVPLYSTDEGADITILISSGGSYTGNIGKFYLGNEKSIILMLLKRNIVWVAICLMILIISFASLVCFFIYQNIFQEAGTFIYLFMYGIACSVWCFSQLKVRQIFVSDIHFWDDIGYLCFMLVPVFVIAFFNWIIPESNKVISAVCYGIILINFIFQSLLQIKEIMNFYDMILVTEALYLVVVIISLGLWITHTKKDFKGDKLFPVIGLSCLGVGILIYMISSALHINSFIRDIYHFTVFWFLISNMVHIFINITHEQRRQKDAENANAAKSQFLATMSHEIRTPINAVLGMNEMILRESDDDTIRGYADNIHRASKSLLSLVNDILDFSKIESGKMDIVCVEYSMKAMLRDLILMIRSRMGNSKLELILNIDETIPVGYIGDEVRIKQILTNILTNAVKYTQSGSVTLTVEKRSQKDDEIVLFFSVKDTGIGIKPEDIDKLLNSSFIRVDQARNRNIEGTGLGISITRQLLSLMESKLEIDSEYGKGSDFHFELTQKISNGCAMGSVDDVDKVTDKKKSATFTAPTAKILAVDDNKINLVVLKNLLKVYKCQVVTVQSGAAGIEACKKEHFDMIFMDHMMPEIDGIETLHQIRQQNLVDDTTKIIALTANAISGAAELYKESGFHDYMTKPIEIEELDICMGTCLDESKKEPIVE